MAPFILISVALGASGPAQLRPVGVETVIPFAGNGALREWRPGSLRGDVLFVRDRTEQWYKVTLTGPCRFDQPLGTLNYTTDPLGRFDRFSRIRVARYPQQTCGVRSVTTSLPPEGHQGRQRKR